MRLLFAATLLALGTGGPAPQPSSPVLVELFTSEGCSSCPPADALLSRLQADPRIVALAYHVDYWDSLGWKDPFASAAFTGRQREHAARFDRGRLYTPQMVVDGAQGFVGSDEGAALRSIAAGRPKPGLRLSVLGNRLGVDADAAGEIATVWLALAEDGLESRVLRGENAGRALRHDGVVRELRRLDGPLGRSAFHREVELALRPGWARGRMKAVVFLQAREGRILAVASARL